MKESVKKPGIAVPRQREGLCKMKKATSEDRAAIAAKVSVDLVKLAAGDAAIAEILAGLHGRLRLWRLCTDRRCRRARGCRSEVIACAAGNWPAFSAVLEAMVQSSRRGRAAKRVIATRLLRWESEGGVLAEPPSVLVKYRQHRWPKDESP